jgi:restriction system protein
MAIPDYQSCMRPLLEIANDGQDHSVREAYEQLTHRFQMTEEERQALIPSGRQRTFENRVGWAKTYLTKAMLLEGPSRGVFRITERGKSALRDHPEQINTAFLRQFPEFLEFQRTVERPAAAANHEPAETPEEALESSYQTLGAALAEDLLARVKAASPQFFEQLVVDLLVAMGYGGSRKDAGKAVGRAGDDGIDGIINEDKLGLDVVYIQAKRWQGPVGRPQVQGFAGSLEGHRARKGVLITTSYFTPEANEYVQRIEKKIVLIDGQRLAELMIDHDVGVADIASYKVKRVDLDYFPDDQPVQVGDNT